VIIAGVAGDLMAEFVKAIYQQHPSAEYGFAHYSAGCRFF